MADNKTQPTNVPVGAYLETVNTTRRSEAELLITLMRQISGVEPVMWGPSIIGFGTAHYKYDTGREGDMPQLGFSPRQAAISVYFSEGFTNYVSELAKLGKHKQSVSCLFITKLSDVDLDVLADMLRRSFTQTVEPLKKPVSVEDYIKQIPVAARPAFDELRQLVATTLPHAAEVMSYGVIGYKIDSKRARVFISGWKDHLGVYPIPNDAALRKELEPYIKGKGTLWFALTTPLPTQLVRRVVLALSA